MADAGQQAQLNHIRQLHASAETKARYASDLFGTEPTAEVNERLEPYAREAIELFYTVGQLAADPSLALPEPAKPSKPGGRAAARKGPKPVLPGQPGFDEWCLTDAAARGRLAESGRARKTIRRMWKLDPDPERTVEIHRQIEAAVERGDVAYASVGRERIHFHRCPWGPVYIVKRGVSLGGAHLRPLQQFVFEVGVEGGVPGEPFRRAVTPGHFTQTDRVDYGARGGR